MHCAISNGIRRLLNGGDLQSVLAKAPESFPWLRRVQIARDVAQGIEFLHNMDM